jgi:hypothetical protein
VLQFEYLRRDAVLFGLRNIFCSGTGFFAN